MFEWSGLKGQAQAAQCSDTSAKSQPRNSAMWRSCASRARLLIIIRIDAFSGVLLITSDHPHHYTFRIFEMSKLPRYDQTSSTGGIGASPFRHCRLITHLGLHVDRLFH